MMMIACASNSREASALQNGKKICKLQCNAPERCNKACLLLSLGF
jgi:hypothetical protein